MWLIALGHDPTINEQQQSWFSLTIYYHPLL
jgi:hypothetical protein